MHVLFVEVDTEQSWAVAAIGPGFLGAHLRANGHQSTFTRLSMSQGPADLIAQVQALSPDLVGLSMTTRQWLRGRAVVGALREVVDVPVVAGGLHATFSPDEVLSSPGFDFVCVGEGEGALLDLVTAIEAGATTEAIPNIQGVVGTPPTLRAPFDPMDALPFLARDHLDEHPGVVHMTTQRGCPFKCTYCAARMYNQLYKAQDEDYGRRRSVRNVMDELHGLKDAGRLAYIIFLDDTFTINHPWVKRFCEVHGRELKTPFSLHARVETVNKAMLHQLADAGCAQITYGVESGSERIRREVMRRPVGDARFHEVFGWTRDAGIGLTANFMLGLPEETPEDLEMTYSLAESLGVLDFGYFVFYPYPGTQLFHTCKARGYLPDDYLSRPANHRASILTLPTLTNDDIGRVYDKFTALRRRLYVERLGFDPTEERVAGAADHVAELAARS